MRRPEINSVQWKTGALAFFLFLTPLAFQDVWAWGAMGHRIIGEIAEMRLTFEVKTKIHENFNIKKLSDVANWADEVRKKRSEGSWHYCNIKESKRTYIKKRDCPDGACVVEKVGSFTRAVTDEGLSGKKRAEALKYLIHFVGDVHQPLHLGGARDLGGNNIMVNFGGKTPVSLHSLWDWKLIRLDGKSLMRYSRDLSRRIASLESGGWNSSQATAWANESRAMVLDHVYSLDRSRDGRLSKQYIESSRQLIDLRLAQAGVRLAGLLNRLLE